MQPEQGQVIPPETLANYAVHVLAIVEIPALAYFAADLMGGAGADSGGHAMGLFFFFLPPLVVVLAGLAAFHFSTNCVLRGGGLALMLLPAAAYVWFAAL